MPGLADTAPGGADHACAGLRGAREATVTDTPLDRPRARAAVALALLLVVAGCATAPEKPAAEPSAPEDTARPAAEPPEQPARDDDEVTRDVVKPSHPVRYTVERGDTLWDIASMFLRDPWVWPEIWSVNPQIENPHLIYPGDVITLAYVGGEPRLRVERPTAERPAAEPAEERPTRRLEPEVRRRPLDDAIASIPGDAIRQFLNRPNVVSREQFETAPYILGDYEGRLVSATGDTVFARGFDGDQPEASRYSVFRPGEELIDPGSGEVLGYEVIYAGRAAVREGGTPARLQLIDSTREILRGDRLLPDTRPPVQPRYIPKVPGERVDGQIISLFDAITQVGSNQVVVLNLGEEAGMEVGTVLGVEQSGGTVRDVYGETPGEEVELPPQRVGTVMVFQVFERVSYALVMQAQQPVRLHDRVTNP